MNRRQQELCGFQCPTSQKKYCHVRKEYLLNEDNALQRDANAGGDREGGEDRRACVVDFKQGTSEMVKEIVIGNGVV